MLWALAIEGLSGTDADWLFSLAREAGRHGATETAVAHAVGEVRKLYERAGVVEKAVAIAREQRTLAAEAVASCRLRRLREVLEFLLDLAVPEGWTGSR